MHLVGSRAGAVTCASLSSINYPQRLDHQFAMHTRFLHKDMEHLINQENRLFPQVNKPIMQAEIRGEGNRFSISAVSMRTE